MLFVFHTPHVKQDRGSGLYQVMGALSSPTLSFSRDGRRLLVADHDAVTITDTVSHTTSRISIDAPLGVVGFADQVWIAHGRSPELSRFGVSGARIEVAHALPGGAGELVGTAAAAPGALWTGYPPVVITEEQGTMRIGAAPGGDVVIPLTARRWIVATGSRVTLPSGITCELGAGARALAASIALDATAILVLVETPHQRELVLIGLANGRAMLRQAIANARIRVATRRGLVAVQIEADRIGVVDLRTGRVIGEVTGEHAFVDLALDPDGRHLAVRRTGPTGENVEILELRAALEPKRSVRGDEAAKLTVSAAAVQTSVKAATADDDTRVEEARPVEAPRAASQAIVRPLDLRALAPVERAAPLDRETALELLDREVRRVALWTLCEIADGWDTRRIGYGNEGHHPFEHEVAALVGMNGGFAGDHVVAARALLAEHDAAAAPDARAPHAPLGALARELGLSPLALDILLVVAAPALWSDAARLYGVLANDPGRALVDEALVDRILAGRASRHDIALELDPRSALVKLGIVHVAVSSPRPFGALTVDPVVLARLRRDTPDLGSAVTVRGSDRALEELVIDRRVITDALAALARTSGHARICVRGRAGSGRRTLLASLAAEVERPIGVIDVVALAHRDRVTALRASLRRVQLAGLLPCVLGLEQVIHGEHDAREALGDVLRAHPGPLAVVLPPGEEPPLEPGHVAIEVPVLAETVRAELWQSALAEAGLVDADASVLAARYRVGPGVIYRAIAAARERGEGASTIESFIRQTRDTRLGAHARRVDRLAAWDQLVLPTDIRDSLRELIARVRHRRTVFETWGMDRHVATSRGLTALFSGPPGTGKTLVAGVIARELGLDLYQVELSKLMSKWIGETERNLATIFDAAEDGQVVLLFDEADSLFAKRTEVRSSNDRYANLEVNYLLQRLDSFEGIAILTTNASTAIDPAFKRRMSFRLSFPFPDEETRVELWRAHLPPSLPLDGELALDKLAHKYQLSGGYIRNACLRAAFLAAQDAGRVTQHHLERAVALEFAELGKLSSSGSLD